MSSVGAEAGHLRSRGRRGFRGQGRNRAPPGRAVPAHGRRHSRHEPESLERVEGAAARGPVPCNATRARRRGRAAHAAGRPLGTPGPGAASAAPLRRAGDAASRALWRHLDTAVLPAPHRRGDRVACAAPVLARRQTPAGRQGPALANRRRAAGARLPAGPEGAVRTDLRLSRAQQPLDPRGEGAHDAARLRARHVHGA